jgi:hypothetical protein
MRSCHRAAHPAYRAFSSPLEATWFKPAAGNLRAAGIFYPVSLSAASTAGLTQKGSKPGMAASKPDPIPPWM